MRQCREEGRMKKRGSLTLLRPDAPMDPPDGAAPAEQAPPLVHLRIVGRHGVFLLERGANSNETAVAVVDTRAPGGIHCTCGCQATDPASECEHVAVLRACGFLDSAA
jgi:hypothetical protein